MKNCMLLFLLVALSVTAFPQTPDYVENSYVIVNPGDTIWAKKIKSSGNRYLKSIKIEQPNGIKTNYRASQLLGAGYVSFDRNGQFWIEYERIVDPENPSEYILAERLADGNIIRLYSHPSGFGLSAVAVRGLGFAFGSFGSGVSIDLGPGEPIRRYIIVKEGLPMPIVITERNFARVYQNLFSDCPEFTETMQSNMQYINIDNIVQLINTYNSKCY